MSRRQQGHVAHLEHGPRDPRHLVFYSVGAHTSAWHVSIRPQGWQLTPIDTHWQRGVDFAGGDAWRWRSGLTVGGADAGPQRLWVQSRP